MITPLRQYSFNSCGCSCTLISHDRHLHGRAGDQYYQTLCVPCTEHYIAHIPSRTRAVDPDSSRYQRILCVEVRAQTPADVGKDKMNRGSIDKICAAHLIIPRLLRMPRMTKENFFERPVEGVRLCSFSCSSSRGSLETYRSGRSNLEVECLNAILDTAGLELVTMRPQGPIVGCRYQTGHTMFGRGLDGSCIRPAGRLAESSIY